VKVERLEREFVKESDDGFEVAALGKAFAGVAVHLEPLSD
jgi:hypothetical protein